MAELHLLGAKQAARRIEYGELRVQDYLRSCLERIEARDAQVKAWTFVSKSAGVEKPKASLFGVPIGVKDIFDTYDMPTEYGSPIYAGHQPRADAATVALARRAGGTILGKTVTAEFATFVPRATRNPHNLEHTPGGSSSGSAAAVADFMVPLAFGTQTAGSIIRPASYCGVCALKPTYNTLPRAGFKPGADSLDTIGFYARSVEDLGFFAAALTDRRNLDAKPDKPARIGICRTYEWDRVQPEMRRALEDAGHKLKAKEIELPPRFKGLRESHAAILWYEGSRGLTDEMQRFPGKIDPALRERCAAGLAIDPNEYEKALRHAADCRAHLAEAFGDCDVLLAPAATGEAPKGLGSTGDVACNVVWTLLHTPCVALPAGRGPGGLPLGLQVIGRIGDDARTLAHAGWIEKELS